MTSKRLIPSVFSQGYALVSPDEQIVRATLADTADEAIALKFKAASGKVRWHAPKDQPE